VAKRKSKAGRPSLGDRARRKVVTLKLSELEYAAIAAAVERENAEIVADGNDDGETATVSSWIRDHALEPLGLRARVQPTEIA
jgi:hypothetical protein